MRYLMFFSTLLFGAKTAIGQSEFALPNMAIKLYNTVQYENAGPPKILGMAGFPNSNTTLSILNGSAALQWKSTKNRFHEIEVIRFYLKSDRLSTNTTDINGNPVFVSSMNNMKDLAIRYERIFNLLTSSKSAIMVGIGASPFLQTFSSKPFGSIYFPYRNTTFGVKGFVTPRFTRTLTEKIYLDINVPIHIATAGIYHSKVLDPSIPPANRIYNGFILEGMPANFSLRIGLGFRIS